MYDFGDVMGQAKHCQYWNHQNQSYMSIIQTSQICEGLHTLQIAKIEGKYKSPICKDCLNRGIVLYVGKQRTLQCIKWKTKRLESFPHEILIKDLRLHEWWWPLENPTPELIRYNESLNLHQICSLRLELTKSLKKEIDCGCRHKL